MQRPAPKSRKLLVASLGVASITYVATTTLLPGCGGTTRGSSSSAGDSGELTDSAAMDEFPVGNLAPAPDTGAPDDSPTDSLQIDDFPVANLAVMPDAGMADVTSG